MAGHTTNFQTMPTSDIGPMDTVYYTGQAAVRFHLDDSCRFLRISNNVLDRKYRNISDRLNPCPECVLDMDRITRTNRPGKQYARVLQEMDPEEIPP